MLDQLTVVGAGLIGGSLCLASRRRGLAKRVVCIDRSPAPESAERFCDAWYQRGETSPEIPSDQEDSPRENFDDALLGELAASSLVVLCTPVRTVMAQLPAVLAASTCPVTDCGSTKQAIARAAAALPEGGRFVPGHPMAGSPQGGITHARDSLFEQHRWILCPQHSDAPAAELVQRFVAALGAQVAVLSDEQHDRSVAVTSHLPQVVASALIVLADEQQAQDAAGPGFASATRVAGGPEPMWRDIFETNAGPIASALSELGRRLQALGEELEQQKLDTLLSTLEKARRARE